MLSLWLLGLTVGLLAVALGRPDSRNKLMNPGPLTASHETSLRHETQTQTCTHCHPSFNPADKKVLSRQGDSLTGPELSTQADLCRQCHSETWYRDAVHGTPREALRRLTDEARDLQSDSLTLAVANQIRARDARDEGVACSVCHREHKGRRRDLTQLANGRCAVCHKTRFDSFSAHVEFMNYPFPKRPEIFFSHVSHYNKHFAKELSGPNPTCAHCHIPDSHGRAMRTQSYEVMCAKCHDDDIEQKNEGREWAVVSLPALDLQVLRERGLDISDYPATRQNNRLNPFTRLLLLAWTRSQGESIFEAMQKTLNTIDTIENLSDLDQAAVPQLRAVQHLGKSLHQFVDSIADKGTDQLVAGLQELAASAGHETAVGSLRFARLPAGMMEEISGGWWSPSDDSDNSGNETIKRPYRWRHEPRRFRLLYRPGHHADPVARDWYAFATGLSGTSFAKPLFDRILSASDPGNCLKCHSVSKSDSGHSVFWRPQSPGSDDRCFTRFAHAPHIASLRYEDACSECHALLDYDNDYKDVCTGFKRDYYSIGNRIVTEPDTVNAQFEPLRVGQCLECHKPDMAGSKCTLCHNYHVNQL